MTSLGPDRVRVFIENPMQSKPKMFVMRVNRALLTLP